MFNALVIGCGNIGAGYDWDDESIRTHVKALSLRKDVSVSVFDLDPLLVEKVVKRYNCQVVSEINVDSIKEFDLVSICSPTSTHFQYLSVCFEAGIPLVICEKPVSIIKDELRTLLEKYSKSTTKVLVNYPRRFQPAFFALKDKINEILSNEPLTNISVTYQRGFLNNASHAWDTIQFVLERNISAKNPIVTSSTFDEFEKDSTLSMYTVNGDTHIQFIGLQNVYFSFWEISFSFKTYKIDVLNGGATIQILKAGNHSSFYPAPTVIDTWTDCYKDFMVSVIEYAIKSIKNKDIEDNFESSISMTQSMIQLLEQTNQYE